MTVEDIQYFAKELTLLLARVDEVSGSLSSRATKKLRKDLEAAGKVLHARLVALDPIRMPDAFFDPADPRLFGTFAALALIGQDRIPLADIADEKFYGAGIYAIYYHGPTQVYAPISGKETPIYVGKADPTTGEAKSPVGQGTPLARRLDEHRKNIERAENLEIEHFRCRHLAVASGWQAAAESALISLFHPLWNKETKILLGFGKHGDSSGTRQHRRSPWDVLHPGREWAKATHVADDTTPKEIERKVWDHFVRHPVVPDLEHVLQNLLAQIRTS